MRQKSEHPESPSERLVKNIRRATRKRYSSEEKIRIVLDGLRGKSSIAELCRREGIAESLYYAWSKEFLEAGKKRLQDPSLSQSRPRGLCFLGTLSPSRRQIRCTRSQPTSHPAWSSNTLIRR